MIRTKTILSALGLGIAALCVSGVASATPPHTVDPSTMVPELNPTFAPYLCFETGTGITCRGSADERYDAVRIELECAGQPVYVSGRQRVIIARWHTPDGLAVKTQLQTLYDETLSLTPTGDGPVVIGRGHWHKHYDYPVPGDLDSRVLTETGASGSLQSPGSGVLFRNNGTVTYVPGAEYEVPSILHGVFDTFNGGDPDAVICASLTGQ